METVSASVAKVSLPPRKRLRLAAAFTTAMLLLSFAFAKGSILHAQTYVNPVLFSDYSDPDVIREGNRFYLVASTFHYSPGLPILESPDLVHWTIIAHVLPRLELGPLYDMQGGNRYGRGVWAPAIRKHAGLFYVYFPTPDEGIFVSTAKSITGPWSRPVAVIAGAGYEDPCPFWDDDGTAWLVNSRTGAGPLVLHRMSPDGLHVLDEGKEIVRDRVNLPTLEGPKLYKRNGWYYIFAPFGGVSTGKQVTLRSRSITGPYEWQVSLQQGSSAINGPHQGGWVTAPDGRDWFVHFQSRGAHGRIVHLEPMRWENDWPVMGTAALDRSAPKPGEPVTTGPLLVATHPAATQTPQTSDEFSGKTVGQQWEWNHNPDDAHWSLQVKPGHLRLTAMQADSLFTARNTLTQQMQSESFDYTMRIDGAKLLPGSHAGLTMFEQKASGIEILTDDKGKHRLRYFHQSLAKDNTVTNLDQRNTPADEPVTLPFVLRVSVRRDTAQFAYSPDGGSSFKNIGPETPIDFSWWKGARPAVFLYQTPSAKPVSHIDLDWVHTTRATASEAAK